MVSKYLGPWNFYSKSRVVKILLEVARMLNSLPVEDIDTMEVEIENSISAVPNVAGMQYRNNGIKMLRLTLRTKL